MPTIAENIREWGEFYQWVKDGDEWSGPWGTSSAQWTGCLLPRVFPFLKGRILEIATGYGRWTQFLRGHCASMIGVDLVPACIERCKGRFRQYPSLEFELNDGLTLPMVEDGSIDFAFSFDSLVHAEADALRSYARELARVLKPGAVAFLHHSNLAAVRRTVVFQARTAARRLLRLSCLDPHLRAASMSAKKMRAFAAEAGMSCIQQEIVPWGEGWPWMLDCMSTIVNAPGAECRVIRNRRFMQEAAAIKRISSLCPAVGDV